MNANHEPDDAWGSAMNREFDARVRTLHEAPLSLDQVKGTAGRIRRNRRIAAAGSVLAVAAVITPVAVLASGGEDPRGRQPEVVDSPSGRADGLEYVVDGTWHRADGTEVELPVPTEAGDRAVRWGDDLVVVDFGPGFFHTTSVVDASGEVVEEFESTGQVATNDTHTTIAYVDPQGRLQTRWEGGEATIASGLSRNEFPAAVTGGPTCDESSGCVVYVNNGAGTAAAYSSQGDVSDPGALQVFDVAEDGVATMVTEQTVYGPCSAIRDLTPAGGTDGVIWETCDLLPQDIAPDGAHVIAPPRDYDGYGPLSMSVVDSQGTETSRYGIETGAIADWTWADSDRLVMSVYDGGGHWQLVTLRSAGHEIEYVGSPIDGAEEQNPFLLVD